MRRLNSGADDRSAAVSSPSDFVSLWNCLGIDPNEAARFPNEAVVDPNEASSLPKGAARDPKASGRSPKGLINEPNAPARDPSEAAFDPKSSVHRLSGHGERQRLLVVVRSGLRRLASELVLASQGGVVDARERVDEVVRGALTVGQVEDAGARPRRVQPRYGT